MAFSDRIFEYSSNRIIPCVVRDGPPTEKTYGETGALYMDKRTGSLYKCVSENFRDKVFGWEIVGDVSDDQIHQAVSKYLVQNPVGALGITSTEKNLMLALFKAVPYQTDVSATMKSLEAIWNSGSGGDEGGDAPGVTYYSVTYNLTSVTADSASASVVSGGSLTVNLTPDTNAVLGEVIVTMGGVDVTADFHSNGKISISSVTGDVVVTATATVAKYTQVEYLESVGAACMITPVALRPTDLVECVWGNPGEIWTFPFGAYGNSVHCSLCTRPDGVAGRTAYTRRSGATYSNKNAADPDFIMPKNGNTVYRFAESEPGTGTIYDAEGNALVTLTDESVSGYSGNGVVMGLFHIINAEKEPMMHGTEGNPGMRIYSFKITDVYGTATIDLIPVLDENNVPCMYDKVSGEYLYNASTVEGSAFIAGGAV